VGQPSQNRMAGVARVAKAGFVYFLLVFVAGVVLGVFRELWAKNMVGARAAETAEVPIMVGIAALAALWVVRRFDLRRSLPQRLGVGSIALLLLILAELLIVSAVRGQSLEQYVETRDAVAFPAYLVGLLCFALMPALVSGMLRSR